MDGEGGNTENHDTFTLNEFQVKEERPDDAEINAIAVKIMEQNNANMAAAAAAAGTPAQQSRGGGQQSMLNYLRGSGQGEITANEFQVKEERPDDAEINAIAVKMMEQNNANMAAAAAAAGTPAQQSRGGGQQSMLNYLRGSGQGEITANEFQVKEERPDDAEINAIAVKMMEQNNAKMAAAAAAAGTPAQQSRGGGQQSMLNYLRGSGQGEITANGDDEKPPLDITNRKEFQVKEERPDDAEINAIAVKMMEQNNANMAAAAAAAGTPAQQSREGGQQSMLNYLRCSGHGEITANGDDEKPPLDITSRKGKFGWVTVGGEHIPYIVRAGEKHCSVRIVEQKFFRKYLSYLSSEIFSCTYIRSYYMTEFEAKLFTEIHIEHCDGIFGTEPYTDKDLLVLLGDANEFYMFLEFCYNKLFLPQSDVNHDRCGFVQINKDSVVPYAVMDHCRYVPLFYFEGDTDALKKYSTNLGPWDLAYLKFCCKVQGIRSEFFANDSCQVISLPDIRSFFPAGTVFNEYWPPKVEDSLLVAKNSVQHIQTSWTRGVLPTPGGVSINGMPVLPADQAVPPLAPADNQNQISGWQNMMNRNPHTATAIANSNNNRLSQQNARLQQAQMQHQNSVGTPPTHVVRPFNRNNMHYMNSGTHQNMQGAVHNQPHGRANPKTNTRYYGIATEFIDLTSPSHSPQQQRGIMMNGGQQQQQQDMAAVAAAAARNSQHIQHTNKNEVVTWKNLVQIMDTPARNPNYFPFKMQNVFVSSKRVSCINAKPYLYSELLMTVNDLMDVFFPTVSMHKCREVLQNLLQVNLYAGNLQQKTVLRDQGKCKSLNEVLPLIQLKDVLQYMPYLRYVMLRSSGNDEQHQTPKRLRLR